MSTKQKRIQKIVHNPKDVSFKDLDKVLTQFGFTSTVRGDHYVYRAPGKQPFIIPKVNPVNKTYVKQVILRLELEEYLNELK